MAKGVIPDRWLNYKPVGNRIKGTNFVAFKVPLKKELNRLITENSQFSSKELLESHPNLGLIIDLTNTNRYYEPQTYTNAGVEYIKIMVPGHEVPGREVRNAFISSVRNFIESNKNANKLVGVHCTHGINRTGFLICHFMINELNIDPEDAIERFAEARGYAIERANYIEFLKSKTASSHKVNSIRQEENLIKPEINDYKSASKMTSKPDYFRNDSIGPIRNRLQESSSDLNPNANRSPYGRNVERRSRVQNNPADNERYSFERTRPNFDDYPNQRPDFKTNSKRLAHRSADYQQPRLSALETPYPYDYPNRRPDFRNLSIKNSNNGIAYQEERSSSFETPVPHPYAHPNQRPVSRNLNTRHSNNSIAYQEERSSLLETPVPHPYDYPNQRSDFRNINTRPSNNSVEYREQRSSPLETPVPHPYAYPDRRPDFRNINTRPSNNSAEYQEQRSSLLNKTPVPLHYAHPNQRSDFRNLNTRQSNPSVENHQRNSSLLETHRPHYSRADIPLRSSGPIMKNFSTRVSITQEQNLFDRNFNPSRRGK